MNAIFAIARRETSAYFASPIGWISLCGFVLISGFFFVLMLVGYAMQAAQAYGGQLDQMNLNDWIIQPLFGNLGVIALLVMPALTMRLFAEDRQQKSLELLLTSPISSIEIVLGKFLGALGFTGVMVASTLQFPMLLNWLGEPDVGVLITNYLGFVLLLAAYVAVGLFASSLTENQLIALIIAFAFNMLTWIVGWVGQIAGDGKLKSAVEYISMLHHVEELGKGVIHAGDIFYFLSFIAFFLFAATQRVEALRWR